MPNSTGQTEYSCTLKTHRYPCSSILSWYSHTQSSSVAVKDDNGRWGVELKVSINESHQKEM